MKLIFILMFIADAKNLTDIWRLCLRRALLCASITKPGPFSCVPSILLWIDHRNIFSNRLFLSTIFPTWVLSICFPLLYFYILHNYLLTSRSYRVPSITDHVKGPLDDYMAQYPKVKIVRLPKREGLIRARLMGLDHATAPVVTYLDSHCECAEG